MSEGKVARPVGEGLRRQAVPDGLELRMAFVHLRELIATDRDLARRLDELVKRYDAQFRAVFEVIRQLMALPEKAARSIGFRVEEVRPAYRVRRPEQRARV